MRFREGLAEADRDGDLIAGYVRLLNDPDPTSGRRLPKIGVVGRTYTSRSIPTPNPTHVTRTRDFVWHLHGSSPTTGIMRPGSRMEVCCVTSAACRLTRGTDLRPDRLEFADRHPLAA